MSLPPAIVLGLGATGLAAVRSLGGRRIRTVGASWKDGDPGLASRFCSAFRVPDPVTDSEGMLSFLLEQVRRLGPVVVLPTTDSAIAWLCRNHAALGARCTFTSAPPAIVETLLDKRRQHEVAVAVGIGRPATAYPAHADQIPTAADALSYPAFVKPARAFQRPTALRGKGRWVENAAVLRAVLGELLPEGRPLIAESVIPGPTTSLFSACVYIGRDGRLLGTFVQQKLRQAPIDFGVGTLVQRVFDAELIDMAARFCRAAHYTGMAEIEFKRDARDGSWKLIEMNARLWEQCALARLSGVDFPYLVYRDLAELPESTGSPANARELEVDVSDPVRRQLWWDALEDFYAFREHRLRGDLSWSRWIRDCAGVRVHSVLALDDPRPFLALGSRAVAAMMRTSVRKLFRR